MAEHRNFLPIEVFVFLYMGAFYLSTPAFNEYIQHKICLEREQHLSRSGSHVNLTNFCDSASVSGEASKWESYLSLSAAGPSILAVAFIGSYSDMIGRKPILVMSAIFSVASALITVFLVYYDLSFKYLFIAQVLNGCGGSFSMSLQAAFASIADVTSPGPDRTRRIAILEGVLLAGMTLGGLSGGLIVQYFGYLAVFFLLFGLYSCSALSMLFFGETLNVEKRVSLDLRHANIFNVLSSMFHNRETTYAAAVFLFCIIPYFGLNQIVVSFTSNVFDWDSATIGYYNATNLSCRGISLLVVLPLIFRFASWLPHKDHSLMIVGIFFLVVQYSIVVVVPTPYVMFGCAAFGLVSGFPISVSRAIMSKASPQHLQGIVFSSLAIVECAMGFGGPAFFGFMFSLTVHQWRTAAIFIAVVFFGIAFVISIFMLLSYKKGCVEHSVRRVSDGDVLLSIN